MPAELSVTLPDGSAKTLPQGATGADLAASIGRRLSKDAVIISVDGRETDLAAPLTDGAKVEIVTPETDRGRYTLRHSTAHVLAQAVLDLFPGAHFAIGPPIENGFYYDFALPDGGTFSSEDLDRIEARMREIIAADQPFIRQEHPKDEALRLFSDQPFKREIIDGAEDPMSGVDEGRVSCYANPPNFVDLCRGPHVPSTGRLGHFKLMRVAGAYWRGDEKNPMLQRIYGTAWESEDALERHLYMLAEAEKRDHRRIGEELDLFTFSPDVGKGLPLWMPKGTIIKEELESWAKETERRFGYDRISTPHITKQDLFFKSGHLPYYADTMYAPIEIEGENYYLKPMNCPHHHTVFLSRPHSYKELPIRYAEYGTVYRYEKSGQLFGLMRVRGLTQNDAHIYCSEEQAVEEFLRIMELHEYYYRALGIDDYHLVLALRDTDESKYHDDDEMWQKAESITREAVERSGIDYVEDIGGAAHYGPKVDFIIKSAVGREFSISTNQVDLYMPKRFNLTFTNKEGKEELVVVQHRAPLGSHERFIGFLIEHFAGAFPTWLSPVQVRLLGVRGDHDGYARQLADGLKREGFRADWVPADEPLGSRIRKAKLEKLPYVLVVGDSDVGNGTVGVNTRGKDVERDVSFESFVARLRDDVLERRVEVQ